MRLIDADALTDEIMERYCKECDKRKGIKNGKYRIVYEVGDAPCRACPIDDTKDELDNAPTIEPEPHWIPCSERLPEVNGDYLVTGRQGAVNKRKYEDGRWYGNWAVLAWMPLPERYGGDEE